jgi:SAM-dependent methyltransferase
VQVVGYAQILCRAIEVLIGSFAVPPIIAQGDIFNMTEVWTDYFDLVFNEGVPQHWPEDEKRQKCINEMVRVTRPGGTVIIIGNDGTNPDEQKIDESFNFEYMGMPPKRRCFTPMELKDKMVAAGLKDVGIEKLRAGPNLALIGGYGRKG